MKTPGPSVDDLKGTKEAPRKSEERFRALVTASSDALYRMSPDWAEMRQLHSRSFLADNEHPSRTRLQEYIYPDDQPHVTAAIMDAEKKRSKDAHRALVNMLEDIESERGKAERAKSLLAVANSQLVSAQESERKRISYDLHDNVWQMLSAIRFEIDRLSSGQEDWEALRNKSKEVTASILGTVGKIRSMQGDLWPYVLADIGILATINWYCREFKKNHSGPTIKQKNQVTEDEIPSAAKIVIYRILQEALSNVVKHSQASQVIVSLMKKENGLEFAVKNNGSGFDLGETLAERMRWAGLGLSTIRARTELSGGSFEIESVKGQGTIVRASWPL
ncbi:MAG: sensor histidine kinase [Thermodesulfobacteriota bacterium]